MKEIENFIREFIEAEYTADRGQHDIDLSDSEHEKLADHAYSFYGKSLSHPFLRGESVESIKGDKEIEEMYLINYNETIKPILFQIKQYKYPELGGALKSQVQNDEIWACYVSSSLDTGKPLGYRRLYYIAKGAGGLKIIYYITFDMKKKHWRHSVDLETVKVLDPGKLIAVEKYQAPEEDFSLLDYNK